mmetsp:Transcript_110898/g.236876  ORF Transcript_110898/g.236876 Transcript_110898/m.236876 type:complete len:200 (-) Transcript_110898:409-1008(-)
MPVALASASPMVWVSGSGVLVLTRVALRTSSWRGVRRRSGDCRLTPLSPSGHGRGHSTLCTAASAAPGPSAPPQRWSHVSLGVATASASPISGTRRCCCCGAGRVTCAMAFAASAALECSNTSSIARISSLSCRRPLTSRSCFSRARRSWCASSRGTGRHSRTHPSMPSSTVSLCGRVTSSSLALMVSSTTSTSLRSAS